MREPVIYQAKWLRTNHSKSIQEVLDHFPRLMYPGMIGQDFQILHGEAAPRLFEQWLLSFADKVLHLARPEGKLWCQTDTLARNAKGDMALRLISSLLPPPVYKFGNKNCVINSHRSN